jgi:hypothetical protein
MRCWVRRGSRQSPAIWINHNWLTLKGTTNKVMISTSLGVAECGYELALL